MRFKPPPQCDFNSNVGWRVEFRTTELQFTDFENAAFVSFLVLLTRVILSFRLSKVDENMRRAQKRNACLNEKFYFKLNDGSVDEISIDEIVNGGDRYSGLLPLIRSYLAQIEIDCETNCKILRYLKTIENKANGRSRTAASWMRHFVMKHPSYMMDSKVNNEIAYDLMWTLNKISSELIDLNESNESSDNDSQ